jgi:hypothetical protein
MPLRAGHVPFAPCCRARVPFRPPAPSPPLRAAPVVPTVPVVPALLPVHRICVHCICVHCICVHCICCFRPVPPSPFDTGRPTAPTSRSDTAHAHDRPGPGPAHDPGQCRPAVAARLRDAFVQSRDGRRLGRAAGRGGLVPPARAALAVRHPAVGDDEQAPARRAVPARGGQPCRHEHMVRAVHDPAVRRLPPGAGQRRSPHPLRADRDRGRDPAHHHVRPAAAGTGLSPPTARRRTCAACSPCSAPPSKTSPPSRWSS